MSLISQIAKNTIYQIFGKFFGTILGLLTVGLMTRYLGQFGYGYYTTVVAFLQFFGVLVDFGLQMTGAQMLAKPGANEEKIFANIFTLRFFSSLIFLGLAAAIGLISPYPLIVKEGIIIASFSFFFISLQSVLVSVFQKNMAMAKTAVAEVISRAVSLSGVYLVILLEKGLLWLIMAITLGSFINFLILFVSAFKYFKIKFRFNLEVWRTIWQTTWPLALTIGLTLVYFRADTIIMSWFRPQNEVGLYGAPYKVLEILIQFPYLFLGLLLPVFAKFFTLDQTIFKSLVQKSFNFLIMLIVPMIFATVILGEKIMVFVAGPEFALSGELLKILVFAAASIYLGSFFGYIIVAIDQQKKMVKFYIFDAIISLILYFALIPTYSYWAAAYLTVLTELIITVSAFYILRKQIKLTLNLDTTYKSIIASLMMSLVLLLLLGQNLLILVAVGLVVYFWALYLMKGFSKQTIKEIVFLPKN